MAKKLLGKTDEQIQDIVGSFIVGQNDANLIYDDTNNQLAIDVSTLTNEQVEDIVGSLLTAGNATNLSYDDSGNTLTVDVDESSINASNLNGNSGSPGQVLKSDGSNTLWGSVPRQIYGNGSDGSITHSSYTTVNVLECENYTLQSGTTVRPSNRNVIIHATDYIEINGEIDARGYGANGGSSRSGGNSQDGEDGDPGNVGAPGEDGDDNGYGDNGGNGGIIGGTHVTPYGLGQSINSAVPSTPVTDVYEYSTGGGGGGSGGYDYAGDSSGSGGDGGGIVVLCAPSVTVNGTIDVEGEDGGSWADRSGAGGPGGGGAVIIVNENFNNSGTYRLKGGKFNRYNDYGNTAKSGSVRIINV